jgi:hypothetical protein
MRIQPEASLYGQPAGAKFYRRRCQQNVADHMRDLSMLSHGRWFSRMQGNNLYSQDSNQMAIVISV